MNQISHVYHYSVLFAENPELGAVMLPFQCPKLRSACEHSLFVMLWIEYPKTLCASSCCMQGATL